MTPRERIENTIAGHAADRTPVALWRRFPGDDQRSADFASSVVTFQQLYTWDFVTVCPASTYSLTDYGLQSTWDGAASGDRTIDKRIITRSLQWTELRTLDPQRGELGKNLESLRLIRDGLDPDTPIIMTIYSPLAQAERLAGRDLLMRHIRTRADRMRSGLNILTENILRFVDALKHLSINGVCYVVEHGNHDLMSENEYAIFGLPYDRKILSELAPNWWLNMLSIQAESPMFNLMKDYPVQAVNWHTTTGIPDLPQGKSLILGAVCGGLSAQQDLLTQTPAAIRNQAREAMQLVNNRRMILSADAAIPITTPLSNIRAVRSTVETAKGNI